MKIVDYFSQDEINNFLDYVGDSTPGEARTLARQEVEDLWLLVQDEFDAEGIARSQAGLGDAINYLMDVYHEQRREFSERNGARWTTTYETGSINKGTWRHHSKSWRTKKDAMDAARKLSIAHDGHWIVVNKNGLEVAAFLRGRQG